MKELWSLDSFNSFSNRSNLQAPAGSLLLQQQEEKDTISVEGWLIPYCHLPRVCVCVCMYVSRRAIFHCSIFLNTKVPLQWLLGTITDDWASLNERAQSQRHGLYWNWTHWQFLVFVWITLLEGDHPGKILWMQPPSTKRVPSNPESCCSQTERVKDNFDLASYEAITIEMPLT